MGRRCSSPSAREYRCAGASSRRVRRFAISSRVCGRSKPPTANQKPLAVWDVRSATTNILPASMRRRFRLDEKGRPLPTGPGSAACSGPFALHITGPMLISETLCSRSHSGVGRQASLSTSRDLLSLKKRAALVSKGGSNAYDLRNRCDCGALECDACLCWCRERKHDSEQASLRDLFVPVRLRQCMPCFGRM